MIKIIIALLLAFGLTGGTQAIASGKWLDVQLCTARDACLSTCESEYEQCVGRCRVFQSSNCLGKCSSKKARCLRACPSEESERPRQPIIINKQPDFTICFAYQQEMVDLAKKARKSESYDRFCSAYTKWKRVLKHLDTMPKVCTNDVDWVNLHEKKVKEYRAKRDDAKKLCRQNMPKASNDIDYERDETGITLIQK